MTPARRTVPSLATLLLAFLVPSFLPPVALGQGTCAVPKNPIEAENCLPGTPASQWYVDGAGSPNIQGFTTDVSVNVGQTIYFKISTSAVSYRIDIYRLGYYQGNDGRFITSVSPSVSLPQIQASCLSDSSTGLIDCGNWGISASWTVPSTATSGVYFARLVRPDTGEVGSVIFVVRNDSSHSDILVQTSDTTWQAYNDYGGNSLYSGNPVGRAYKVSYNRPVNTLHDFFSNEYNMLHWLEANGYDVTYSAGTDTDRNGAPIKQHRVFLSVGHDEYWSGGQRANVEVARAAGVNLAFFSGNEVFWKTRWEPSIDGTNTPYRTLVCYKETSANARIDPLDSGSSPTWTGFWRDARFSPPADGGRPENALTGTASEVSAPQDNAIAVPQADGRMRFWRNTSMATLGPGQVATLPTGTLGYESDEDLDNGFRPAGLIRLSTSTVAVSQYLYFSPTSGYYWTNGTEMHHLTLYRAPSGALVFGAGTIHWSQAVENDHGGFSGVNADPNAKQATVNLLADMGVQPATLQGGLLLATASTDTIPPRSAITSPSPGTTVTAGSQVTILGTAQDFGGGVVGGVEVSVDGGATWHPAVGRENWSYVFTAATSGALNVLSRAVDDSGNLEAVSPGTETVTVSPSSVSLSANQQKQFTATVTATSNQTVSWSISAVSPASAPAGNISSTTGLYTAPATITPAQVTIKATSADGTASGTATVTLSNGPAANFTGSDTSTQGSWHGVYGADGYSIANDAQSLPAYVSFAVQNQRNYTWASSTTDPRGLQNGSNTGRIASQWFTYSTFDFDVNFADGNTHRFALYALDWDSTTRAESVQIADANSGVVLDTRNVSLFHNGLYLIWNLSGHVKINVTLTGGSNATISGAFFGGSTTISEAVTVSPSSVSLSANQQKQFTATVTGTSNQTVSWSISAVSPASAPAGNISSTGLYTAPATITPAQVTIKATSADGTASGTATVTLSNGPAANFIGSDTSTQGNWHGVYGADGYSIANDAQSLPGYASFAVQNQQTYTWASGTTDPRALQNGSNTGRIASQWFTYSTFDFDVNFTDGKTHQFALYALDWDNGARAESVQIVDANSSVVLDTRNVSLFNNGLYLIWNLSGHVKINVTLTGGSNATISGAFFGGSSGTETVTVSPSSVSLSANQQKQFTATVTATSNQTVSWSISAVNPASAPAGNLSSSGLYTAPATIAPAQVTIKATSADGTASGTATVTLSNGATANFAGSDSSTQGNWHGVYGADGYSVANDAQSLPAYASFALQNQRNYTWASSTTDPRALQNGSNTGRIASQWFTYSTFDFDVNFTDGNTHRFALYALDWDSTTRAESVQIVDANSGVVLDTRNVSLFHNGLYLIWNLSGHVKINVTLTGGSNATISGAFFR